MRTRPVRSTYRLQLHAGFGFADAARVVPYLARLGVSHLYLSPVLAAAPGSQHGYDVVDHAAISPEAGGRAAFDQLVETAHAAGLGLIVDIVPNHMAFPEQAWRTAPLWSVLRDGQQSAYASWFDIDWTAHDGRLLVPVLGSSIDDALSRNEIRLAHDGGADGDEVVVRYYDTELPVAPGTDQLPLRELLSAQHWLIADWRAGTTGLNYRRFFDVTGLIAVRVEDPQVFAATHELVLALVREGAIDGLRVDHPDGLADPRGYVRMLRAAVGPDVPIWVEKILEGAEQLPADWPCEGTTGYDALERVSGLLHSSTATEALDALWQSAVGDEAEGEDDSVRARLEGDLEQVVDRAKDEVTRTVQAAEVERLVARASEIVAADRFLATRDDELSREHLRRALRALLVAMDRYRAYVVPGEPVSPESAAVLDAAYRRAAQRLAPEDLAAADVLRDLLLLRPVGDPAAAAGARLDLAIRFQQVCGPVMAKGIEDTAFYRYLRLVSRNEVGGDPARVGLPTREVAAFFDRASQTHPATMTALSTHDTKRAEAVRARIAVISHRPQAWTRWLEQSRAVTRAMRPQRLDAPTELLAWQTLVGAWPIDAERLGAYLTKAAREAKLHTAWVDGDEDYEQALTDWAGVLTADPAVAALVQSWLADTAQLARAITLGQKAFQLALPGMPDTYQGTELVDLSLVDPDNRRPVDYAARQERLARLETGDAPADLEDELLLTVTRLLHARAEHAEAFAAVGVHDLSRPERGLVALARGAAEAPALTLVLALTGETARDLDGSDPDGHDLGADDLDGVAVALPATELVSGMELTDAAALAEALRRRPVAVLIPAAKEQREQEQA